jgi:transposase-like protein
MRKHNLNGRPKDMAKREAAGELLTNGASIRKTAETLHISTSTVQSVRRETRIDMTEQHGGTMRDHYGAVIADLEREIAVMTQTLESLKRLQGIK